MNALLLIAHGSRRQASNDEVRNLAKTLSQNSAHDFGRIECAFLELAEPSIPEGVSACARQGAKSITILPYFLSSGRHVTVDIPAELEKAQRSNPQVQLKMAPYLGAAKEISDILIALSKQAA